MIYLDNAATTLYKPPEVGQAMLDALQTAGNPGRGAHAPTLHASRIVYETREALARLFHAEGPACIAFASNATQALNTAINGLFGPGDHVITTVCEHNSVLRLLYRLQRQGVEVSFVDVDANGVLCYAQFEQLLRPNTRGVVVTGASNVTGNRTDLAFVSAFAKKHGLLFLVDAAQTAGAMPVDVQALDADFLVFSGHKLMAPMGIGVLYGKETLLDAMPPFLTGGEMIDSVSRESAVFAELPHKFEAGTVNGGGAVGLQAAIDYLMNVGFDEVRKREELLTTRAMTAMQQIPGVHIQGSDKPEEHNGIISFTVDGVHPHDIASILDAANVNVRAGHHCAQPLLKHLGVFATARASFAFYNTEEDIDRFVQNLKEIRRKMGYGE